MANDAAKDKEAKTWKHEKGLYVPFTGTTAAPPRSRSVPGVTRKPTGPTASARWAG